MPTAAALIVIDMQQGFDSIFLTGVSATIFGAK